MNSIYTSLVSGYKWQCYLHGSALLLWIQDESKENKLKDKLKKKNYKYIE